MIIFYLIFFVLSILGALHFYEKRKGCGLALSVFNIAMYFRFLVNELF
jgi:hypothetical protein